MSTHQACDSSDLDSFHIEYDAARAAWRSQRARLAVAVVGFVISLFSTAFVAANVTRITMWLYVALTCNLCSIGNVLYTYCRIPLRYKNALTAVAAKADYTSLERLLEAIGFRSPSVRKAASIGVVRVMSSLDAAAASTVNRQTRDSLFALLKRDDPDLVAAILTALPMFEDAAPLKAVTWLAEGQGAARSRPDLQALAQQILPGFQAIAQAKSHQENLLRSSTRPDDTAETALRPAVAGYSDEPETLLRAGGGDGL